MPTGAGAAFSVAQSELLIALEAVRGTAAATTMAMPYKAPKYKPDLTLEPDETLQGSMATVYDLIRGLRYDSHGWDSYPYLDSFPVLLAAALGSPDTVGTAPTSTTTDGTAVAGATTLPLTANSGAGWVKIGSGATQETRKITTVTGSVAPFSATLATPLAFAHGTGETVTGLTSHEFSLLNNSASTGNQPPSCTINDYDGDQWRQITAAQLSKLTVKGNATGLVDYTVDWVGNAAVTPSPPSYSPTTAVALPGWTAAVSIGGTLLTYVESWELDLNRDTKPVPAVTGTQAYFDYWADALTVTGKITVIEQAGGPQFVQYLAGTKEVLDITVFDLTTGNALDLHATSTMFKTGALQRGAKGQVKATFDIECLPNTTDATAGGKSHMTATVANGQTTAYAGS